MGRPFSDTPSLRKWRMNYVRNPYFPKQHIPFCHPAGIPDPDSTARSAYRALCHLRLALHGSLRPSRYARRALLFDHCRIAVRTALLLQHAQRGQRPHHWYPGRRFLGLRDPLFRAPSCWRRLPYHRGLLHLARDLHRTRDLLHCPFEHLTIRSLRRRCLFGHRCVPHRGRESLHSRLLSYPRDDHRRRRGDHRQLSSLSQGPGLRNTFCVGHRPCPLQRGPGTKPFHEG